MTRAYTVVDVFTSTPLKGNPVAVILDSENLDTAAMQAIAAWTNLSETTFLCPPTRPEADYLLRIFTPRCELPFAGHPTLGSAHAAVQAGRATPRNGQLVQECGVGLVNIRFEGESSDQEITLTLPPAKVTQVSMPDVDALERALGAKIDRSAPPAVIDVGPVWVVAKLAGVESAADVIALKPVFALEAEVEKKLGAIGTTVFGDCGVERDEEIEVRTFNPLDGMEEDPVCGSGNGAVAIFRYKHKLLAWDEDGTSSYVAAQGQCVGRSGRVKHRVTTKGDVEIGGKCVTTITGTLRTATG